ncbi:hypothetical protein GDO86_009540 [Hymenochirus boettgeri]|uniref:T-cell activation Rho GTPase-activating protein n=1 Tax=Hymenochirus boettgeri TaxID=247094 RepID=A0A8T2JGT6_9PIPI|nr:hypothetical protein GDO86_009540 [Hymenochirus boettgeri]
MMALPCGEEDEEEEACAFHSNPRNALLFIWPCHGCIASFRSLEVKELWLDTLVWQIREVGGIQDINIPYIRPLMKVLTGCSASKAINVGNMEHLIECHTEADAKKYQLLTAMIGEENICQEIDSNKKRRAIISWPFTLKRSSTLSETDPPELKLTLFEQPLSIVCEEDTLPQAILDILKILRQKGPTSEGIFRKAANEKVRKELKEDLNCGKKLDLKSKPVHLLAVVLKDFLRGIPHQLLSSELYPQWMNALEKPGLNEKIVNLKCVADKLPRPNWILLQHLICVLHHISKASAVNKMDSNNLAVCIGPNLLLPHQDKSLLLDAQKQLNDKVVTLVEFFIDNCFDLFGENVSELLGTSEQDSLDDLDVSEITSHQNDSAYDSTDPEHEGYVGVLTSYQQDVRICNLSSNEKHQNSHDQDFDLSLSTVTHCKNTVSSIDRRRSEPYIFPSQNSVVVRRKLTRSHDDVTSQKHLGQLTNGELSRQEAEDSYKKIMAKKMTLNSNNVIDVFDDVLQNACSDCSLDSSYSDCSVFTSSPLVSPTSPKKNSLQRHQSMKNKHKTDLTLPCREIKKHSNSFNDINHKKLLTKTQSWGPEGEVGAQRHICFRNSENARVKGFQQPAVVKLRHPQSYRKLSVEEVFRIVDQRHPGKPPSYDEAIQKKKPSFKSLTIQTIKAVSPNDCSTANSTTDITTNSTTSNSQAAANHLSIKEPSAKGLQQPFQAGKAKSVLVRTMSESARKHKHECLSRRCSQPFEIYEQIQYAKESYV